MKQSERYVIFNFTDCDRFTTTRAYPVEGGSWNEFIQSMYDSAEGAMSHLEISREQYLSIENEYDAEDIFYARY